MHSADPPTNWLVGYVTFAVAPNCIDVFPQLVSNKLPTYVELDSDNFQEVMNAAHKPLVVLVAAPKAELASTAERVRAVAQQWKDSKAAGAVVFTTMDADKWAKWLGSMYGIKPENGVSVVVANHSVSCVPFCCNRSKS